MGHSSAIVDQAREEYWEKYIVFMPLLRLLSLSKYFPSEANLIFSVPQSVEFWVILKLSMSIELEPSTEFPLVHLKHIEIM